MAMDLYSRYGASLDRLREQFRAIREDSEKTQILSRFNLLML